MSYSMFMLTSMTGKEASSDRTVIISGFEIGFRTFLISCLAAIPGLVLALVTWPFLGSGSILMFPISIAFTLYLVQSRSREGLKLRTYQTMLDKRKANSNTFFVCGQPVDLDDNRGFLVCANTVPADGNIRAARPTPIQVVAPAQTPLLHGSPNQPDVFADELIGTSKARFDPTLAPARPTRAQRKHDRKYS